MNTLRSLQYVAVNQYESNLGLVVFIGLDVDIINTKIRDDKMIRSDMVIFFVAFLFIVDITALSLAWAWCPMKGVQVNRHRRGLYLNVLAVLAVLAVAIALLGPSWS